MRIKASGMIFSLILIVTVISFQIYQIQSLLQLKKHQLLVLKHHRLFYFINEVKFILEHSDHHLDVKIDNIEIDSITRLENNIYYKIKYPEDQKIFCFVYCKIMNKIIDIAINDCFIDNED